MGNFGRKISLMLSVVFLAPVATKAMLWSFEEPRHWQTARWSSAGILPEAVSDPQARIVVFAARTAGVLMARMTSGWRWTSSAARFESISLFPSA